MKREKTLVAQVRLKTSTVKALKEQAQAEGRSFAGQIRRIVEQSLTAETTSVTI